MPRIPNLDQWFDRLVRHGMRGAALATAGIAISYAIMLLAFLPWDQPFKDAIALIGLAQLALSSLLFLMFIALQLRDAVRKGQN